MFSWVAELQKSAGFWPCSQQPGICRILPVRVTKVCRGTSSFACMRDRHAIRRFQKSARVAARIAAKATLVTQFACAMSDGHVLQTVWKVQRVFQGKVGWLKPEHLDRDPTWHLSPGQISVMLDGRPKWPPPISVQETLLWLAVCIFWCFLEYLSGSSSETPFTNAHPANFCFHFPKTMRRVISD